MKDLKSQLKKIKAELFPTKSVDVAKPVVASHSIRVPGVAEPPKGSPAPRSANTLANNKQRSSAAIVMPKAKLKHSPQRMVKAPIKPSEGTWTQPIVRRTGMNKAFAPATAHPAPVKSNSEKKPSSVEKIFVVVNPFRTPR